MKKDVVVGKHENIVKGAIERELRKRVDVINKRGLLWHEKVWKYCKKL
jgi:hypothetical protein